MASSDVYVIPAGQVLSLTADNKTSGSIYRLPNVVGASDPYAPQAIAASSVVNVGPFADTRRYQVNTFSGKFAVTLGPIVAPLGVVPVTPGASPYVYQLSNYQHANMLVTGGTVSLIQISRDGTTYFSLGLTSGQFDLCENDYIKVTYSVAPTMSLFPG